MVNAKLNSRAAVLLLALCMLAATAVLRGAEYDEQYTLFLTAGVARPAWPAGVITAGRIRSLQSGHAGLAAIARDLRRTDVHPPLYFWAVASWRRFTGPTLLAARLFSVSCSMAALAAVGLIAWRSGVPATLAMLLTLGCYGFAYTGAIARNFALAQALLLWGTAALLARRGRGRAVLGGALLGAAAFTNYLAVVPGVVALLAPVLPRLTRLGRRLAGYCSCSRLGLLHRTGPPGEPLHPRRRPGPGDESGTLVDCGTTVAALLGYLPFLLGDFWFFIAQRDSRPGQFPPFHGLAALADLAHYAAASMLGGLPLYVAAPARTAASAAVALVALAAAALIATRWHHMAGPSSARWLWLAAALASPCGLLALGAGFGTTPIALRYLVFSLPFVALLLAGALATLPRPLRHSAVALLLCIQAASLAGMMTCPETMQPARATAASAARLAGGGLVLLPRGNDGVGIVGAFALEAPPDQRLLLVPRGEPPARILARVEAVRRVVLALLAQDDDSRATLPALQAAFATPCWRRLGEGYHTVAFERVCVAAPVMPSAATAR